MPFLFSFLDCCVSGCAGFSPGAVSGGSSLVAARRLLAVLLGVCRTGSKGARASVAGAPWPGGPAQ